jgi:hypothetical protein
MDQALLTNITVRAVVSFIRLLTIGPDHDATHGRKQGEMPHRTIALAILARTR